ncbi:MAG: cytochrome c3 family protein [Gallionella sp.]
MPKLIDASKRFLPAPFAITLLALTIQGCMQKNIVQNVPVPQSVNSTQYTPAPQDMDAAQYWNTPHMWYAQQNRHAQSDDCRSCHATNGAMGAKDFSAIYANPGSHHPVGVKYPLAAQADPNFQIPDSWNGVVAFFDRNGNGQPDSDEVVLFGTKGAVTVECASCHREHGSPHSPGGTPTDSYLRVANTGSELCITCHRL